MIVTAKLIAQEMTASASFQEYKYMVSPGLSNPGQGRDLQSILRMRLHLVSN